MAEQAQQVRRLVPARFVPALVRWRLKKIWGDPQFRADQEAQMRFLLEYTERADEIAELAHAYAEQMMIRAFLRWHPRAITRQRVRGIEWLTTGRDASRGTLVSFTHHHRYEGLWPSLARAGAPCKVLVTPEIARPEAGIAFQQHLRIAGRGSEIVLAEGGTEAIAAMLRPGVRLAMAPDFPGRTPVTFLGRPVLGSFGTARIATMTNSQVVLVTVQRDDAGPYVQVHEPIEPSDYADPGELLSEILQRHGAAILAWPEALEAPTARFATAAP